MSTLQTVAIVACGIIAIRLVNKAIRKSNEKSRNTTGDEFDRAVHRANESMFAEANRAHQFHAHQFHHRPFGHH